MSLFHKSFSNILLVKNQLPGLSIRGTLIENGLSPYELYYPYSLGFTFKNQMISKRVFPREISSRDETRPRMKLSLPMVKCFLLFTSFCRDKISSRDERQG